MAYHGGGGRAPAAARKRSQLRLAEADVEEDGRGTSQYARVSAAIAAQDRLPMWQVGLLLLVSVSLLWAALTYTHPRLRSDPLKASRSRLPSCFPLEDKETVKLLGSQNRLVHHAIASSSDWAQTFFDLGLLAAHGFNQLEAANLFRACLRADASAAMCAWGLAYTEGPMPNKAPGKLGTPHPAFLPTHATDALHFSQTATRLSQAALGSPSLDMQRVKRDSQYIEAMAQRFAKGAAALKGDAARWREHEAAYARRMAAIGVENQDADALALAAESLMNLTPWDYYAADGSLRPTAAEAEALLRKALALAPQHTHALHLHIHIAESGTPVAQPGREDVAAGRALGSADTLAQLDAQNGHLMHMPSHIYVRTGRYARAVQVNKAAYEFDLSRGSQCIAPYLPEHNVNVLVYAASMAGMQHTAEAFATGMRSLRDRVPDAWLAKGSEWVNLPLVQIRYGEWQALLDMPAPPKDARGVTTLGGSQWAAVVYHAGRTLALAARAATAAEQVLGVDDVTAFDLARKSLDRRYAEVSREHKRMQAAVALIPAEPRTQPGAPPGMYASDYAALARALSGLVKARLALLHKNTADASTALQEAVAVEDSLGYMEPPRVHQPLRQCLGWLLLTAGQHQAAGEAYQADLARHPSNGWSLLGLEQLAQAQGADAIAAAAARKAAWADAEVQVASSCPALARPFPAG